MHWHMKERRKKSWHAVDMGLLPSKKGTAFPCFLPFTYVKYSGGRGGDKPSSPEWDGCITTKRYFPFVVKIASWWSWILFISGAYNRKGKEAEKHDDDQ